MVLFVETRRGTVVFLGLANGKTWARKPCPPYPFWVNLQRSDTDNTSYSEKFQKYRDKPAVSYVSCLSKTHVILSARASDTKRHKTPMMGIIQLMKRLLWLPFLFLPLAKAETLYCEYNSCITKDDNITCYNEQKEPIAVNVYKTPVTCLISSKSILEKSTLSFLKSK